MLFCLCRLDEGNATQEEIKETISKKKKSRKNVFKVEDIPNNNCEHQNEKRFKKLEIKSKITKNREKHQKDSYQNHNKSTINIKNGKKDQTQNKKANLKIVQDSEICQSDSTQNQNKMIKNNEKGKRHIENKTKANKKVEKRKMDHTRNGSNKKRKFSDMNFKPNKELSAIESMTDDRLKAYGINPKKFRNKLKFGNS